MWGWIVRSIFAPLAWNLIQRWVEEVRKWFQKREEERIAKAHADKIKEEVKIILKDEIKRIQNDPNLSPVDKELELEKKFTEGFLKLRGR